MSTPSPSPIQNAKTLWPPWRLPNGISSASEDELERASTSAERWGWANGGLVVAGVLGEIVLAIAHLPYDSFRGIFCSLSCDAAIAIGVAAEVGFAAAESRFQSELMRRIREKLADAVDRATKAELQLAPRSLTGEQVECLLVLRGVVPAVTVTCAQDFEATRFAAQIGMALQYAGVEVHSGTPRIGLVWSGVYIVVPEKPAAFIKEPLYQAFSKAGLSVGCGDRSQTPMADLRHDLPVIMVGEKGFMYPTIPYVAGFDPASPRSTT